MAPLILFAALFLCGVINSYFFPLSKLYSWLRSLSSKPIAAKKPSTANVTATKMKEHPKSASGELETIFSTFDSDDDGFITLMELEVSLRRLKLRVSQDEVRSMMERVDANGDGLIDVEEFRNLYESLESSGEETGGDGEGERELVELREAFEVFDGNKDGVITVEELAEVLVSMGLKQGEEVEDCRDMITRVDLDGDGMVNFQEFKKMMMFEGSKL